MSEPSLLEEAISALRAVEAEHSVAASTEQRMLESVRVSEKRTRWTVRIAMGLALGLFMAGTGHAAILGAGRTWSMVLTMLGAAPVTKPEERAQRAAMPTAAQTRRAAPARESEPRSTEGALEAADEAPAIRGVAARPPAPRAARKSKPSAVIALEGNEVPVRPAEPSSEALYAEAHRLHFVLGDKYSALDAWNRYLAVTPSGGLAPEARYNRALCLVALDRKVQAIEALTPIAAGAEGAYRRKEARKMIHALRASFGER
jgi:hypothetical protein